MFRTVGLIGDGETGAGESGGRMDVMLMGDFSDNDGRLVWLVAVEMFKDNLGLTALEASMLTVVDIELWSG